MFKQKELPRAQIKQDFSKDIQALTENELNSVISNFRRFKAKRLEEMRNLNPDFGSQKQASEFNKERRSKILNLIESIISRKDSKSDALSEEYYDAVTIVDWYLTGQKKQAKKEEGLKTREMRTN